MRNKWRILYHPPFVKVNEDNYVGLSGLTKKITLPRLAKVGRVEKRRRGGWLAGKRETGGLAPRRSVLIGFDRGGSGFQACGKSLIVAIIMKHACTH